MRIKTIIAAAALVLLFAYPAHAVKTDEAKGALFAASDGKGSVTLVWYPAYGKWPAGGWRLTDSKGGKVADNVKAMDKDAIAGLDPEDADGIGKLVDLLVTTKDPAELGAVYFNLGVVALTDVNKARALGLAWTVQGASAGKRTYKAAALDGAGKTIYTLTSPDVDPSTATPLPPSPEAFSVKPDETGAMLYWSPVKQDRDMPVLAYVVERDWSGQSGVALTDEPVFLGGNWDKDEPAFQDLAAPVEQELTYRVYAYDVFGRRSAPAAAKLYMPDLKALLPPTGLKAEAGREAAELSWKPNPSPNTAGYVVERSFSNGGIYEVLTPKGLGASEDGYTDKGIKGGSHYYYRVRSIGPRGGLGEPTAAVMASPKSADAPDRPEGLKAASGPAQVRLTWDRPDKPVSGYIVERMAEDAPRWVMLNPKLSAEPRYDDEFNLGEYGSFSYRVTAVGFDGAQSKPSREVEVVMEDTSLPPVPHATGIDGEGGKAVLSFSPGAPEKKTDRFLVLRGTSAEDPGLVMGEPLPGSARSFTDVYVKPGKAYWYAVVALDAKGNRSEMSERLMVLVGTPDIPVPPAPQAAYAAEPFGHVEISFAPPPEGFTASVQYGESEAGPWTMLAASVTGEGKTVHTKLPDDAKALYYRVVYKAANGVQGAPSAATGVNIQ